MNINKFPWLNGGTIEINVNGGLTILREYDDKGNQIHYKDSDGFEVWREYDANGREIHVKVSDGVENWFDSDGEKITKEEFDRIHSPSPCEGKIVEIDGKKYKLTSV